MTEKKYRKTVERLGGVISRSCTVDFPDTLRINNKEDALDLLRVLYQEGAEIAHFTVIMETPIKALMTAIKKGIL